MSFRLLFTSFLCVFVLASTSAYGRKKSKRSRFDTGMAYVIEPDGMVARAMPESKVRPAVAMNVKPASSGHINTSYREGIDVSHYQGRINWDQVAGLQVCCFFGGGVENANGDFVACHSCHRVFLRRELGHSVADVYQGEVRHHALVHAVKCEKIAFGTPESTFVYAELIAVDTHSVLQFAAAVGGYLMGNAVSRGDVEVPVFYKGSGF